MGHHAVDSRGRKHERDKSKRRQQHDVETLWRDGQIETTVHRDDVFDQDVFLRVLQFLLYWSGEAERIPNRSHEDSHLAPGSFRVRLIRREIRLGIESVVIDVADYADDRHPRLIVRWSNLDPFTDRVTARPVTLGHLLVDNDDVRLAAR